MVERIRCPNCGAINYGDVKKCWKCGASLTPQGEQPPGAPPPPPPKPTLEETLPQKVPRIKYPILYPIGALIFVVGMVLGVFLLYLLVDAPEEIRNNYDDEHAVFAATQDFPVTVMGEVTAVSKDTDEYGYYLYELDGDGVIKEKVVSDSIQPDDDLIVRSKKPTLAKEGDKVMWEVDKRSNDVGQDYLVVTDVKNPTLYRIPGAVIAIFGVILIVIGYVGIPDKSMLELMQGGAQPTPPPAVPPTPVQPQAPPTPQPAPAMHSEAQPEAPPGQPQPPVPMQPQPEPQIPPEGGTVEAATEQQLEGGGSEEVPAPAEPPEAAPEAEFPEEEAVEEEAGGEGVEGEASEGVPAAETAEDGRGEA